MNNKISCIAYGMMLGTVVLLGGCNSRPSNPLPSIAGNTVAAFLTDSPSDGVVSFRIDITGAALVNSNGAEFNFSSGLQQIELRHLQLAPTLALQTKNAPNGNYTGLRLTFANPQITLCDAQGNVTILNAKSVPSVSLSSVSINLPISVILQGNMAAGLMIDFDLRQSIQTDSRGNYVITPVLDARTINNSSNEEVVQNAEGTVLSVPSAGVMNLQLADTGQTVRTLTNQGTAFAADSGPTGVFGPGDAVEFDAQFHADGTLYTDKLYVFSPDSEVTFRCLVTRVTQDPSGHTSIEVVSQE